ncbi:2TM domain-containing protein [Hazenella sp. IB182357]|uniref:2TM domain-containing protein n=1 Tax=Polycladospora coralii TaxID=2771432 RepID=A0A926NBI0_9BACL|nr:2TM domain-containing protein [Polycladospora coralii]MBD1373523.1 2TM domain-containing protein [Polycladospora coralii]MBS7531891.1 2TM domain-containing protein [Polycladospora coralii]
MDQEQIRKYAEKKVREKQDFYNHLLVYILVNLFILIVRVYADAGLDWTLIFPALPWGIGLAFHWFHTFFGSDPVQFEKKVQKEMERYENSINK